jgi:hypothetical protein
VGVVTVAPMIVSGVTGSGMRWAQLWHPEFKVAASLPLSPLVMAHMRTGDGLIFGIQSECPTSWMDLALRMFATFRKGDLPDPTHVLSWKFGQPSFEPIAEQADGALFDMEGEAP